tara:strand:+ start:94 stop:381 length:288 start_codon:yes stop_codon:yes gene_type:complete
MKKNITRKDIGKSIYSNLGISKTLTEDIAKQVFKIIMQKLRENHVIKISNFGNFKVLNKKERIGRNPKNKIETKISARSVVVFKSSDYFKNKINE